jgi:hypothetical protein
MRGSTRFPAVLLTLVLATVTAVAVVGAPAGAQTAPSGALTRDYPNFPNYFFDNYRKEVCDKQWGSGSCTTDVSLNTTAMFADSDNGTAFQWNLDMQHPSNEPCGLPSSIRPYDLLAYDIDTYQIKARGCIPSPTRFNPPLADNSNGSKSAFVAVDSTDRLVFMYNADRNQVWVVSENTLKAVASWALPPGIGKLAGFSWYPPTNELLILTDGGPTIASYDIASSLAKGSGQVKWTYQVKSCASLYGNHFSTAHPYRSLDLPVVFVPCNLHTFMDNLTGDKPPGVVKVALGPDGKPSTTEPEKPTAAPVNGATDFMFDPGSDRGFLPVNSSSSTDVYVYDGKSGEFLGQANVASNVGTANALSADLDERTGRFYVAGSFGIFALEGRRTPISPGDKYNAADFATGAPNWMALPVLPPTKSKPYIRVLANYFHPKGSGGLAVPDYFTVLADNKPIEVDPPPDIVDRRTYTGEIGQGTLATSFYTGGARGYGAHSYLLGGAGGIINNLLAKPGVISGADRASPIPEANTDRDLLAAYVSKAVLKNGSSEGSASAFADGNGQTASTYGSLTSSARSANDGAGHGISTPETTRQLWPYPNAECSYPGAAKDEKIGFYRTTWAPQTGHPPTETVAAQAPMPGSDSQAYAGIFCPEASPVAGAARFMQFDLSDQGLPDVYLSSGSVATTVKPPTSNKGITASAQAEARGIRIDLGGGQNLTIGKVVQEATATAAGRPGTAKASKKVTVWDLVLNGQVLCGKDEGCSGNGLQVALDQVNTQIKNNTAQNPPPCQLYEDLNAQTQNLNTCQYNRVHIFVPDAYDALLKGTPGGFKATVEPTPLQQSGDLNFNKFSQDEATILPGLRILLSNDGWQLSREVLDLAGVGLDTQMGVELIPADELPPLPLVDAYQAAGVAGEPGYTDYIPGSEGGSASISGDAYPVSSRGITGILKRVFKGFATALRSPGAALQMFAFLALLAAPAVITSRRRLSLADPGTGA